jgi:hypothetical protein
VRPKNEEIQLFILDEGRKRNREHTFKEKVLREWLQEPTEQPVTPPQNSLTIPEELSKRETTSPTEKPESDPKVAEHVEIGKVDREFSKTGILGPERKGQNFRILLGIPIVTVACSLISIFALLRLDAVVHRDLYSYGLQFSLEWATPYWLAIRTALGLLWLIIIASVLFQVYILRGKRGKGIDEHWKRYTLTDGSTIRVKTVLKSVKRLNECGQDGKPIYSIEADIVAEVVEVSRNSHGNKSSPTK